MKPKLSPLDLTRREFLSRMTTGFTGVALTHLLAEDMLGRALAAGVQKWSGVARDAGVKLE